MANESITIEISKSEALVFFEFLWRFSQDDVLNIEDQAEQRLLWYLCASLESKLAEPFSEDYDQLLANARARVRDEVAESEHERPNL